MVLPKNMEKFTIKFKAPKQKRRADFLFNDGEFKPRTERNAKVWRRKVKNLRAAERQLGYGG